MTILLIIAAVAAILVSVIALQPSRFSVTRSATISAPPEVVFPHVNDLHKWQEWSPWAKMDPTARLNYEGPIAGKGAIYSWAGNAKVGQGRMTIIESRPGELVRFKLEFFKPFKATNTVEFTFAPVGDQTKVSWTMSGTNSFMCKAIGLFVNCEKMCGGMFEQGLASMKSLAETTVVK